MQYLYYSEMNTKAKHSTTQFSGSTIIIRYQIINWDIEWKQTREKMKILTRIIDNKVNIKQE